MRLAYFSPLNPQKSGISDYSEELLPALGKEAEIDIFVDDFNPENSAIREAFPIYDYRHDPGCLKSLNAYDAVVCHLGNSYRYHGGIYEISRSNPSVVVFHDIAFQHFFLERAREKRDPRVYLDELDPCDNGRIRAEAEEAILRGEAPPQYQNPLAFPMNFRLANQAEGIIVHSDWSRSRLMKVAPAIPVTKINLAVTIPDDWSEGIKPKSAPITIASFGFITASKGLESAIRALAALKPNHEFHYYLVGERDNYFEVDELTKLYGMSDRVSVTGYVDLEEFKRRIASTDIALNLRDQTVGETSASLCRLMAAGVPTIVSNIGWFSELPDDCVIKVDHGPDTDLQLSVYLRALMQEPELRQRIGENARRFMLTHHQVGHVAGRYIEFIEYVISRRARRRFMDSVSSEIALLSEREPNELMLSGVAPAVSDLLKL